MNPLVRCIPGILVRVTEIRQHAGNELPRCLDLRGNGEGATCCTLYSLKKQSLFYPQRATKGYKLTRR